MCVIPGGSIRLVTRWPHPVYYPQCEVSSVPPLGVNIACWVTVAQAGHLFEITREGCDDAQRLEMRKVSLSLSLLLKNASCKLM